MPGTLGPKICILLAGRTTRDGDGQAPPSLIGNRAVSGNADILRPVDGLGKQNSAATEFCGAMLVVGLLFAQNRLIAATPGTAPKSRGEGVTGNIRHCNIEGDGVV